ncbi:nitroreductase [Bifidobacterium sp. ESL0775]|uniref:nitroreductase family protein n=1 Tax=Bifidobacterium sp. ESL0775 TaxID=2983230 RepID=UPI0023F77405|nr:nitroreductase family protein [Bifidobacterium sp. ESL0775]WEV69478.1 nitroreductase [Bifidobacterium sp. ESL0775]
MMKLFTNDWQRGKMDLNEAMTERHSVRMYTDEPVDKTQLDDIAAEVERCNAASGLHFQMAAGLEDAFCGYKTHYGRFSGVHNAIALVTKIDKPYDLHPAKKAPNAAEPTTDPIPPEEAGIEEKVGYYGEQLALKLVQLGLATSWAVLDDAATGWWKLEPGERVVWVLAFGHPARAGAKHHSKPLDSLCSLPANLGPNATLADAPDWFRRGIEAASLAPTSLSQQPFHFTLKDTNATDSSAVSASPAVTSEKPLPIVSARATPGLFAHVGLGCAKRNFEIGAGTDSFKWSN